MKSKKPCIVSESEVHGSRY